MCLYSNRLTITYGQNPRIKLTFFGQNPRILKNVLDKFQGYIFILNFANQSIIKIYFPILLICCIFT